MLAFDPPEPGAALEPAHAAVVRAIVDSRREWLSLSQIAGALSITEVEATNVVTLMRAEGWLDIWAKAPVPVVTFSLWGASVLRLEQRERRRPPAKDGAPREAMARYRWVPARREIDALPRRPRPAPLCSPLAIANDDVDPSGPDGVVDPQPGPEAQAVAQEAEAARAAARRRRRERKGLPLRPEDWPRPTVLLLGHGGIPWDEVDRRPRVPTSCRRCAMLRGRKGKGKPAIACACGRGLRRRPRFGACSTCRDQPLRPGWYCLRCGRWGLQWKFLPDPKRPLPVKRPA